MGTEVGKGMEGAATSNCCIPFMAGIMGVAGNTFLEGTDPKYLEPAGLWTWLIALLGAGPRREV